MKAYISDESKTKFEKFTCFSSQKQQTWYSYPQRVFLVFLRSTIKKNENRSKSKYSFIKLTKNSPGFSTSAELPPPNSAAKKCALKGNKITKGYKAQNEKIVRTENPRLGRILPLHKAEKIQQGKKKNDAGYTSTSMDTLRNDANPLEAASWKPPKESWTANEGSCFCSTCSHRPRYRTNPKWPVAAPHSEDQQLASKKESLFWSELRPLGKNLWATGKWETSFFLSCFVVVFCQLVFFCKKNGVLQATMGRQFGGGAHFNIT